MFVLHGLVKTIKNIVIVTKFYLKECIIALLLKTVDEQCKKQTNSIDHTLLTYFVNRKQVFLFPVLDFARVPRR